MQVEKRSIDFIPEAERHGQPGSLFFIWFGANMNITTIANLNATMVPSPLARTSSNQSISAIIRLLVLRILTIWIA